MFLADPNQLIDQGRIDELKRQAEATRDPIERLLVLSEIDRLRHPDEAPYREAFIAHAKDWATRNDVIPLAFLQMGVPREALEQAGLSTPPPTGKGGAHGGRPAVRVEDVTCLILRQQGPFSTPTLRSASGASPMTISKALRVLIESGAVRRLGPDPNWRRRGRAPILYELVRS